MSVRTEKVASLIRRELGTIISREYSGGELGFSTGDRSSGDTRS